MIITQIAKSYPAIRLFEIVFAVVGLFVLPTIAIGQIDTGNIPIRPSDYLSPYTGDSITNARLAAQEDLYFNVRWDGHGNASVTSGQLSGGFSNGSSVLGTIWEFTYTVKLVPLAFGEVLLVIDWSRKTFTGSVSSGKATVGKLIQSDPTQIYPDTYQTNSTPTYVSGGTSSGPSLSATDTRSGHWETIRSEWTIGFMGTDGKYYVIGGATTITVWVPDGVFGGGESEN
jgi:hypothetical protein